MSIDSLKEYDGVLRAGGILDRIVDSKVRRLEQAKREMPLERLQIEVSGRLMKTRGEAFLDAITNPGRINIIAEIKRRSPSKGIIREQFDPTEIASSYRDSGAAAISILTEEDFFNGSVSDLLAARRVSGLPVLRKDFLFDPYQVYEAAAARASAILLITAILDDDRLRMLLDLARSLGLAALVEVHTRGEMDRAVKAGAEIIGINNRDLTSFKVDLETSFNLAETAPEGVTLVSESGIKTSEDILKLMEARFHAFLIGERLMTAPDPGYALKRLIEG